MVAGPYRDWLQTAERLRSGRGTRTLSDVPVDMFVDINNALARVWRWQQQTMESGADAPLAADLDTAAPQLAAICYDLHLWLTEGSWPAAVPAREGIVLDAKPPADEPSIIWPAPDGGLTIASGTEDGDSLVVQDARIVLGDTVIDQRFLNALDVATAQWQLLAERDDRSRALQAGNEAVLRQIPSPEIEGRVVTWREWLDHVAQEPPPAMARAIGRMPEDPELRPLWRHAAVEFGKYRASHGADPPTDYLGYVRSLAVADGATADRSRVWAAVRRFEAARREISGADVPGLG